MEQENLFKKKQLHLLKNLIKLNSYNVNIDELKKTLSNYLQDNCEKLANTVVRIAPFEDYSLLMESKDDISNFLKTTASEKYYWKLDEVFETSEVQQDLIEFIFYSVALEGMSGKVFVNKNNVVVHAFVTLV